MQVWRELEDGVAVAEVVGRSAVSGDDEDRAGGGDRRSLGAPDAGLASGRNPVRGDRPARDGDGLQVTVIEAAVALEAAKRYVHVTGPDGQRPALLLHRWVGQRRIDVALRDQRAVGQAQREQHV